MKENRQRRWNDARKTNNNVNMAKKERSTLCKGIMEMVGTGILLVTAQTTSATSPEQVASAVCAVLVAIIYMGVDLSGAHYNPAVTFIFVLRERCSVPVALFYTAMQFSGGLCGAWIAKAINPKILPFRVGEGYTLAQALVGELLFTTLLCLSILTLALRNNVQLSPIFGSMFSSFFLSFNACNVMYVYT